METKKIVCPFSKTEVVLKSWITGEELQKIENPFKDMEMTGGVQPTINIGMAVKKSVKIAVETIVVSVGGATKDIYDTICKMRKCDYSFVMDAVDKIAKDEDFLSEGGKAAAGTDAAS